MKTVNVAIVGATGVVGREIIAILESRKFPVDQLKLLASARSKGVSIAFNNNFVEVEECTEAAFDNVELALFSAGSAISKMFAPIAAKKGVVCIDNTSFFRMDPEVPLVVPEINAHAIDAHKGIIANPNCSTAQLVMALKPIHDKATIKRIVVSTYQSVSGAGKDGITKLEAQSRLNLTGGSGEDPDFPIAFNAIPQIDVFTENGYTKEEMKMTNETQKIMEDDSIALTATAVRVPVFIGHSEAVNIQTKDPISVAEVRQCLSDMPGVTVMDDPKKGVYPTPKALSGKDDVFVGRIRKDISQENTIDLWVVADNLRKGAALNTVQIAEHVLKRNQLTKSREEKAIQS
jgi:aspartate-semialdehyde dehydrogenase